MRSLRESDDAYTRCRPLGLSRANRRDDTEIVDSEFTFGLHSPTLHRGRSRGLFYLGCGRAFAVCLSAPTGPGVGGGT
jgi:hypothetical protein